MQNYQFLKKGTFETVAKFEKRLNEVAGSGWKAIGMTSDHGTITVLLEKIKR